MSQSRSAAFAVLTLLALGSPLSAQSEGLRIRATRRDSITAGATVTAAFAVSSARADTVHVLPHVELPTDWTMLMGGAELAVAPRSTEMLMLSVVVPARAATQVEAPAIPAEASARVTVVPEPSRKIEEYLKVPTQVHLRAASSDGVSPFEIFGRGDVRDGGHTQMDFLFRGPTGQFSAFGERDEYRVALIAPNWRLRAGDQLFMLSSLTGVGQPGFGLGADATHGAFSMGGYGEQFRRIPGRGNETGAFVSARPM